MRRLPVRVLTPSGLSWLDVAVSKVASLKSAKEFVGSGAAVTGGLRVGSGVGVGEGVSVAVGAGDGVTEGAGVLVGAGVGVASANAGTERKEVANVATKITDTILEKK